LIIVLVIALIVFGPKRLPEMGRTVGKGLREFRQASAGIRQELTRGLNEEPDWTPGHETSGNGASVGGVAADGTAGRPTPDGSSGAGDA